MLFKKSFSLKKIKVPQKFQKITRLVPPPKKWTWRTILRGLILLAGAGIVLGIILFAWYYKDLPKPGELRTRNTDESTILYDRNGKQIYDISGDERRILLKTDEIPDIIKKATTAIEDRNFYKHFGVDFVGLFRGVVIRPLTGRGFQGGSTITQQYIKNSILSPKRTPSRKIKELILALELEAIYSKEDILTLYLNEIPYGSNIYGVEAASQAYYGKSAKDGLTLSEAATLAAIPQAPTRYSPYGNNVKGLITRRNLVLDAMAREGHITQADADKAKTEKPLESKDFAQRRDNFPAPHFVMYVREQLVAKYGETSVQRGGLRVTTTLDLDTQKMADDAIKDQGAKTLPKVKASNAAMTALDPKTGQILAMVGSLDYFDRENEGNFNVATAQRQPGSSIKPLVYASLFKDNYSPSSVLWDVETDFNGYKPNNFDNRFHGPLTVRKSLGNSFNIPAVKALSLVGINKFLDTAKDMGITTYDNKKDSGLSLALGAGEVKVVDIASAYGTLANKGEHYPLTAILKIEDSRGKVLDEWKPKGKQVIAPEIAYEVSSMLSDVDAKRPTFNNSISLLTVRGHNVASKTGTTNNYKDAWTVGYTPSIVTAVWAGNNDGSEMERGGGSTAAAPIWQAFMSKYLSGKQNEDFFRPSTITDFTVDMLSGKKPTTASGQLVTDIFAPWQLPSKDDDVHTKLKVCRSNGKLATESTPEEEIEERTYTRVKSERPNDPKWEGPVQAWARGQNLVADPPTEKCDITMTNPRTRITSPTGDAQVDSIFTVVTETTFPPGTTGYVEFFIDNRYHSRDDSDAFTATIDTTGWTEGKHEIRVVATASNGGTNQSIIHVYRQADTTAPGEVSNVVIAPGTTKGTAIAQWTSPATSDTATITFYASQAQGIRGSKIATVTTTPGASQATTLTGLVSGTINYITIVPADTSGNATATTTQYPATPL